MFRTSNPDIGLGCGAEGSSPISVERLTAVGVDRCRYHDTIAHVWSVLLDVKG